MSKKPIVAEIDKRITTIDGDTHEVTVAGKLKGFGQGFAEYIAGSVRAVDVSVSVGQYPETHAKAGRYAIQIMIDDFPNEGDANALADRLSPKMKGLVQSCNATAPSVATIPGEVAKRLLKQ